VYWTTGCGGCDAAFLDLGERLLEIEKGFEIVFFPLLMDVKRNHIESLPDGSIDLGVITGAIRNTEDVQMAHLLRRTSDTLLAFGACAQLGSVLALADLVPVTTLLRTVYREGPASRHPRSPYELAGEGGVLRLPDLTRSVQPVEAVVPVDYAVPGCPPEVARLWEVVQLFLDAFNGGAELPERGSVLGATEATVCEDCLRLPPEGRVSRFHRFHHVHPDPEKCLLDDGLVCSGPATRGGCGAPCPDAGAPCIGCYGDPSEIEDQGARMLGALAAMAEIGAAETDEEELRNQAEEALASLVDPVGTLYRYCFARSLLARLRQTDGGPA
jgi:F420-non-reducing hydrogenase small subunit